MSTKGMNNPAALCYLIAPTQQLLHMSEVADQLALCTGADPKETRVVQLLRNRILMAENTTAREEDNFARSLWQEFSTNAPAADINTQCDASEFFSDMVGRLCKEINALNEEGKMNSLLVGQLVNTLVERDGIHHNHQVQRIDKYERFVSIPVTVNPTDGCGTLESALRDFTREDVLPFRWPVSSTLGTSAQLPTDTAKTLGPPVPTVKTTRFKTLPQYLTFHLKRFYFDTRLMRKVKLHHKFEFPDELDMSPYIEQASNYPDNICTSHSASRYNPNCVEYTVQNATTDQNNGNKKKNDHKSSDGNIKTGMRYRLKGVIVHRGASAYSGHYYSFIRMGQPFTGVGLSAEENVENQWYLFDDADVAAFPYSQLSRETFGGEDWQSQTDEDDDEDGGAGGDTDERDNDDINNRKVVADENDNSFDAGGGGVIGGNFEVVSVKMDMAEEADTGEGSEEVLAVGDDVRTPGHYCNNCTSDSDVSAKGINCDASHCTNSSQSKSSSCISESRSSEDGSAYSSTDSGYGSDLNDEEMNKYRSAFMLFYERV